MGARPALIGVLLLSCAAWAQAPSLNCNLGPVTKTIGGSPWLVYGCDDGHSVVVITAPGSPAAPFYFMFAYKDGAYQLTDEGTGSKSATAAAYTQLSKMPPAEIARLFSEASGKAKK